MAQLRGQIHSLYFISTLYMYSVVCTLVLCSLATGCTASTFCEDSDKIPEDRTSTYILHLSGRGGGEVMGKEPNDTTARKPVFFL
jgi:hypothetical protein